MALSGNELTELRKALASAFPTGVGLQMMLKEKLNKNLNEIAIGDNLQEIIFKVIEDAETKGWLPELLNGSQEQNPGNQDLKSFINTFNKTQLASQVQETNSLEQQRKIELIDEYLRILINEVKGLDIRGIPQKKMQPTVLPLEDIYIDLMADVERANIDQRVLEEELEEIKLRLAQVDDPKEREKQYEIYSKDAPILEKALAFAKAEQFELCDIVQYQRYSVILGEPGSGKTTLMRYLALRFATEIQKNLSRLFEVQNWFTDNNIWQLEDLGPVRFPILIRAAKYSEARDPKCGGNPQLAFIDFLPQHLADLQLSYTDELSSILIQFLNEGRCLILFDGLDEIINARDRVNIVASINRFANIFGKKGLPQQPIQVLDTNSIEEIDPEIQRVGSFLREIFEQRQIEFPEPMMRWLYVKLSEYYTSKKLIFPSNKESVSQFFKDPFFQLLEDIQTQQLAANVLDISNNSCEAGILPAFDSLFWRGLLEQINNILNEAKHSLCGNHFVVTSRIAGYIFAPLGSEFETYIIRPMNPKQVKRFIEHWCIAVEKSLDKNSNDNAIMQRAKREIAGILKALEESSGLRRMATNPLLLKTIAVIHHNEARLPQRRVELYETATEALLYTWNLQRELPPSLIDKTMAMKLLGSIALWMHENRATALIEEQQVLRLMEGTLALDRGEDPDNPSIQTRSAVECFLSTVREHSGIFVERGEGMYGFMHLTFEEYFTARQMISRVTKAHQEILKRLHHPRWREPILLAIGYLSKALYDDIPDLLNSILGAGSNYESVLHRDILFVVTCIGDSIKVPHALRKNITIRLLKVYCDRLGMGRYRLLQQQIKEALLILKEQGDSAVEEALIEVIQNNCTSLSNVEAVLEAIEELNLCTVAVRAALSNCGNLSVLPGIYKVIHQAHHCNVDDSCSQWNTYKDNRALAFILGSMFYSDNPKIQGIPQLLGCSVDTSNSIEPGTKVILGRHRQVQDESNWNPAMEEFVGQESVVVSSEKKDKQGCWVVRVDADGSQWAWRTRDLYIIQPEDTVIDGETFEVLKTGYLILQTAKNFQTLTKVLLSISTKIEVNFSKFNRSNFQILGETLKENLEKTLLECLKTTSSSSEYQEIVLFLGKISKGSQKKNLIDQLLEDLGVPNTDRSYWAHATLTDSSSSKVLRFSNSQYIKLIRYLDGSLKQTSLCLDVLSLVDFKPDFLEKAWNILRQPDHALYFSVKKYLFELGNFTTSTPCLSLINEGLKEESLRDVALTLALKQKFCGVNTFVQALIWLFDEELEIRSLASVLLSEKGNLFYNYDILYLAKDYSFLEILGEELGLLSIPLAILTETTHKCLKAIEVTLENTWVSISNNSKVIRLLAGLWLNGWEDSLSRIWFSKLSSTVLKRELGDIDILDNFVYSDYEGLIVKLLQSAKHGQSLIPIFQQAADYLTELEEEFINCEEADLIYIEFVQKWLVEQFLNSYETIGVLPIATLRTNLGPSSTHPVSTWILKQLKKNALSWNDPPANLLHALIRVKDSESRIALSVTLLCTDLLDMVVKALVEAIDSSNDQLRFRATNNLSNLCKSLPADATTDAVERLLQHSRNGKKGYENSAISFSTIRICYNNLYWLIQWLNKLGSEQSSDSVLELFYYLGEASNLSSKSINWLCQYVKDSNHPIKARIGVMQTIKAVLLYDPRPYSNLVGSSLLAVITDPDTPTNLRQIAIYNLQWLIRENVQETLDVLVLISSSSEPKTSSTAIYSLGKILSGSINWSKIELPKIENLSPKINKAIQLLIELLASPEASVRRLSSCSIVRLGLENNNSLSFLEQLIPDETNMLTAMLDVLVESEAWDEKHAQITIKVSNWILEKPQEKQLYLIDFIVNVLARTVEVMKNEQNKNDSLEEAYWELIDETDWGFRRAYIAVLSELSEKLPYQSFTRRQTVESLIYIASSLGSDYSSFNSRRFAIRFLGNLQHFTALVADVMFQACHDVEPVYNEAKIAFKKFNFFTNDSFSKITNAIQHPSSIVASHGVILLAELAVYRFEQLGSEGRKTVADELVQALSSSHIADKVIYSFAENKKGDYVCNLYDVIYATLVQVVTGSDSTLNYEFPEWLGYS